MLNRHSSRRKSLDASFPAQKLVEAASYDRIAGYFSSSILEVAGELGDSAKPRFKRLHDLLRSGKRVFILTNRSDCVCADFGERQRQRPQPKVGRVWA